MIFVLKNSFCSSVVLERLFIITQSNVYHNALKALVLSCEKNVT